MQSLTRRLLLLLLALAGPPASGCADAPRPADALAPASAAPTPWRVGDAHRYAVDWRVDTDLELAGIGPEGGGKVHLRLTGELTLRVHDAGLLGLRFERVDQLTLDVFGRPSWDDREAARELVGPEILCELGPDGVIAAAYFEPGAAPLFRHMMAGLLVHTDLRLPAADSERWQAELPGNGGTQRARYRRDPTAPGQFRRELVAYTDVRAVPDATLADASVEADGDARINLGPGGLPEALIARESLRIVDLTSDRPRYASRASFSLRRLASDRFEPGPEPQSLAARERHVPGDPVVDPLAERDLAARFADGLSPEQMLTELVAAASDVPVREGLLIQTTGLLRARPELAATLAPPLHDPATTDFARERIFDALSSAGTPEAQAVMRASLGSPRVRAAPDLHGRLLTRLAFLHDPEPATAALALATHHASADAPDDPLYLTTLYALGSVGRAIAAREPAVAATIHATLVERLGAARTQDERMAALAGLGNFASEADAPQIFRYTHDPASAVRVKAIGALRHIRTPEARARLRRLVGDPDRDVAIQALAVLDHMAPTVAEADAIASMLEAGEVSLQLHGHAINVFARWLAQSPDQLASPARRGLLAIATRSHDPRQRQRALELAETEDPTPPS